MNKRIVAVLLSAMLALALLGPGVATAGKSFKTKVTIAENPDFHGKVKSKKRACIKKRKVKLQRKTQYEQSFTTIGSTKSKRNGKWKVSTSPISNAAYRAKVTKKKLRHHKGTCRRATSRIIVIP